MMKRRKKKKLLHQAEIHQGKRKKNKIA